MRRLLSTLLLLTTATATAQDFIHYKFTGSCTNEVINFATGPQAWPDNGTLQSNSTISPWTAGVSGDALAGGSLLAPTYYNRVVSTWNPATNPITGDVTIAWFMRLRAGASIGTSVNYLMGAPTGGFRLFTNGAAGTGLIQREIVSAGGNSSVRDFVLPAATTNIQALAAAGWTHVAIVVDSATTSATWYVNGAQVFQLTSVPSALITLAGPFTVGSYNTSAVGVGSAYDIDEFLLSKRAYSAAEILALSLAPQAGDGDYTSGTTTQCGAGNLTLASTGGRPFAGNAGYGLAATATTPSLALLLAGSDRCTFGGAVPLPLDGTPLLPLLSGCWILADAPVILSGTAIGGPAVFPFAIPATVPPGVDLFLQALTLDVATSATSMSSGFALSTGL